MLKEFIAWLQANINFADYPLSQVILLGFGFVFWVLAYYYIIQGVRKYKIVEIPMIVAALDIAWEFDWAFLLENDLSWLFSVGCALWFFMDCFINYSTLQFGKKLVTNDWIKDNYVKIYLFILISGLFITYFMKTNAEDNGIGIVSAYLINILISSLYIYQLINFPQLRGQGFSWKVAVLKFLGTGSITIAVFLHWSHNGFLLAMCTAVTLMDILYLYLYKNYKPETIVTAG